MRSLLALICVATLCVILTLGLWPFHTPDNAVVWLNNQNGLLFGPYGSAISSGTFPAASQDGSSGVSVEICFHPRRIWDSGTVLAFYRPRNLFQFSLRQSQNTLVLKTNPKGDFRRDRAATLSLDEVLSRENRPVFLSITAGHQGTSVYLNGRLAKADPGFPLSAQELSGYLILGDSPGQSDDWRGEIRSLAIYHCALTPKQVSDHLFHVAACRPAGSNRQRTGSALSLSGTQWSSGPESSAHRGRSVYPEKVSSDGKDRFGAILDRVRDDTQLLVRGPQKHRRLHSFGLFHLPVELMRQAKIYAAQHDTTVNALVRELLQEKISAEARFRAATARFFAIGGTGSLRFHGPQLHSSRGAV